MSSQKNILVLALLILLELAGTAARPRYADYKTKWVLLKECKVSVNGSTNVNTFTCTIPAYSGGDTLTWFVKGNSDAGVAVSGKMALPVVGFDCANMMMTGDLRKTLHAKEFPVFYIHFMSMDKYPALKATPEELHGTVIIELSGVKKTFDIHYSIAMDGNGTGRMDGTQSIHFSDFNLVAPRRLGGMIRANDRLDVAFHVNFRVIP